MNIKRKIRIINFDGTIGSGKTTQINMLAMYLKKADTPVLILNIDKNSALEKLDLLESFLEKNENGIVFCDGSIARMIVLDSMSGVRKDKIIDNYRKLLYKYEIFDHKYGMANILMVMEDIEECDKRTKKREKLSGESAKKVDFHVERKIIHGLSFFDDSILSKNLKFHTINIEPYETILEVQDEIIHYLEENFDISMNKPKY